MKRLLISPPFALAWDTRRFVEYMLEKTKGKLDRDNIGQLAQQIGTLKNSGNITREQKRGHKNEGNYLRNLSNNYSIDVAMSPKGMRPPRSAAFHDVSEVLSGALFDLFGELFELTLSKRKAKTRQTNFSASGYSVSRAVKKLYSLVYPALDYLPPGEISFADFCPGYDRLQ